ncbi:MAG TPA: hypothetical protein VK966_00285, partial [Longimicrobiales bacterium]|nr:hypothetical protein [Longimicrobiales bacterium]
MRYYVTLDGRTLEVDLRGDRPLVDGEPVDAEISRIPGTPTRHLMVDGRSYVLVGSHRDDEWDLHLNGERF